MSRKTIPGISNEILNSWEIFGKKLPYSEMFSKFHFKTWNERRADRNKKMAERIAGRRARKSGIGSKEPMVEQHSLLPPSSMRWSLPVVYARSLPYAFEVHAPWMSPSTKASHRRGRGAGRCGSMVASLTARYDISFDISAHRKTLPCLLHAFCIPCAKNRVSMRNIYIHIYTYIHTYIHIYIYMHKHRQRFGDFWPQ